MLPQVYYPISFLSITRTSSDLMRPAVNEKLFSSTYKNKKKFEAGETNAVIFKRFAIFKQAIR